MQKKLFVFVTILMISLFGFAQNTSDFFTKSDAFFKEYVTDGKVNYKAIKKNSETLEEVLTIAKNTTVTIANANEYQAFWINVYNLSVIKGIVANYPVKSPLDIDGFFEKTKYNVGGKSITLNDIEHKLLRAKFNDPRFHFVLVCAGLGCPPIINSAYLPDTLDAQLQKQTSIALNNATFIQVNAKKKKVLLSEIMKWYKEDFTQSGNEIDFINQYRKEKIPTSYKIGFYPYNWDLNKTK